MRPFRFLGAWLRRERGAAPFAQQLAELVESEPARLSAAAFERSLGGAGLGTRIPSTIDSEAASETLRSPAAGAGATTFRR